MKVVEKGDSDVYKIRKGGDGDVHNHRFDHHVDLELNHSGVEKFKIKKSKNWGIVGLPIIVEA